MRMSYRPFCNSETAIIAVVSILAETRQFGDFCYLRTLWQRKDECLKINTFTNLKANRRGVFLYLSDLNIVLQMR